MNDDKYKKKLLLVEDEAIIAIAEKMQFEKLGYLVSLVYNGEDAIAAVNSNKDIDIILMDIDLGKGIDGVEATEQILKIKNLPVIFLSSRTESEVISKTEKITSYGCLSKNSNLSLIDASIKMAFKLYEANTKRTESEKKYISLFENLSDALAIHEIICDPEGKPVDYRFLEGNAEFLKRVNLSPSEIFGKTALELFPGTEKVWIDSFGRVALSGKSESLVHYSVEFDKYYEARIYSPERGIFAALFIDIEDTRNRYEFFQKNIAKD